MDQNWQVLLLSKSVPKQRKFKEITDLLGGTDHLHCLDIGSDNGVISYLLRKRGGIWKSADLDEKAVRSIHELVGNDVYLIDGLKTPFQNDEFDRVVIVDFLEHVHTDREFIDELFRIIKPGGELIVSVPHIKNSLLRKFRQAIGQTDEQHGHVRPGYTVGGLTLPMMGKFTIVSYKTYSKFFSECINIFMAVVIGLLKKEGYTTTKGHFTTGKDLHRYKKIFRFYSLIYPVFWFFSKLDMLLFWCSGYMLIVKAKIDKKQTYVDDLQTVPSLMR